MGGERRPNMAKMKDEGYDSKKLLAAGARLVGPSVEAAKAVGEKVAADLAKTVGPTPERRPGSSLGLKPDDWGG
jgi:hypothetical protein